jgi:hypothetical protein
MATRPTQLGDDQGLREVRYAGDKSKGMMKYLDTLPHSSRLHSSNPPRLNYQLDSRGEIKHAEKH